MEQERKKDQNGVCVLVSGGVESSVLMSNALDRYERVTPLYVRGGLRWETTELFWLKNFHRCLRSVKLNPLRILEMPMRDLYDRHWSITGIRVPGAKSRDESMYLPGRNIVLLAKAACFAALHQISAIEIGVLKGNPFSDSTSAFFKKIGQTLSAGLGSEITIKAPFQKYRKEEVILLGKRLPLELTFSCVNPKGLEHCGDCNKCTERKKSFFAVGLADKTSYKKPGM